jgi:xanthine permease
MSTKEKKAATRPEDERLPLGATIGYGIQHVLTMYGGIIAPPLIIGQIAGLKPDQIGVLIAACLFMGGLATILQTVGIPFFGSQLPLVQGVSFAGVATMAAIVTSGGGLPAVFGSVIAASVIGLLIAPVFATIIRFFPPVVTGTVITTIGLSLLPVAAGWIMGGEGGSASKGGAPESLMLAGITLVIVLILSKVPVGAISRLAILLSIVIGTIIAVFLGKADFSKVLDGDIFALPQIFGFGVPTFPIAGIISMVIVILVTLTETTADILAVSEIVGTKVDSKRIAAGLRADMLSSAVSPIFGTFTQSAFAQNVGLVAITGVKSRFVVTAGGGVLVILGLLPVLGRVVGAIPQPVLGGAGLVLFGSVAASGIRTLARVEYKDNMNLVIVATSIAVGMLPIAVPTIYAQMPAWFVTIFHSGISSAAVVAILLNLLFNHLGSSKRKNAFVSAPTRSIPVAYLDAFEDGDSILDGKIVDRDGNEVAIERPAH